MFGVSSYIMEMNTTIDLKVLKDWRFVEMYDSVLSMLDDIKSAYIDDDTKKARKVYKKDKVLNKININAFQIISEEVKKDPNLIDQYLLLFSVIKKIERIGDLITNIAEEIIFYREAEILKHQKKKKVRKPATE